MTEPWEVPSWFYEILVLVFVNLNLCSFSGENFNSKSLVVSAQKKILTQLSMSKSVQKTFLDDEQNRLLQLFYELSEEYLIVKNKVDKIESKKQKEKEVTAIRTKVHKVHKDLIKLMVKISVLSSQHQLIAKEYDALVQLRSVFQKFIKTFITYQQLPDCYNRDILIAKLAEMKELCEAIITRPLSDKSGLRLSNVFDFFMDAHYIDSLFTKSSPHKKLLDQMCEILQNQLNNKSI